MRRRAWGYPVVEYVRLSCTALPLPVVDDGCCAVQLTGGAFCNSGTPYGRFNQDLQRDSTAVASAPVWTWGDTPCSGCVAVPVVCSLPTFAASLRPCGHAGTARSAIAWLMLLAGTHMEGVEHICSLAPTHLAMCVVGTP